MGCLLSIFTLLLTTTLTSLSAAAAPPQGISCEKSFQVLGTPSLSEAAKAIIQADFVLASKAEALSHSELLSETAQAIRSLRAREPYLPGLRPGWSPTSVEELLLNFRANPEGRNMLRTVANTLGFVHEQLRSAARLAPSPLIEGDRALLQHWENDGWHFHVFKELEKRARAESTSAIAMDPQIARTFDRLGVAPTARDATTIQEAAHRMRQTDERLARAADQLPAGDVLAEIDQAMSNLKACRPDGFLPGCGINGNPASVRELIRNFRASPPLASQLHQITANLAQQVESAAAYLARKPDGPLTAKELKWVKLWEEKAWYYQLFLNLEKRLLEKRSKPR